MPPLARSFTAAFSASPSLGFTVPSRGSPGGSFSLAESLIALKVTPRSLRFLEARATPAGRPRTQKKVDVSRNGRGSCFRNYNRRPLTWW